MKDLHLAPIQRQSLPSRGIKASTLIWMEEKVIRDSQLWNSEDTNLWIVQNKLYDLNEFASKHPGGQAWIKLTKGQDITQHFVVHHLNQQKARQVLSKHYVRDCKKKVSRFSFQKTGLYRAVKDKMLKKFSINQLQDQTKSKRYAIMFISLFLTFLTLSALWSSYIFAAVCSLILIGIMGIGHNFVHHRDNLYQYYLLLCGFTPRQWKIMHCISHHMYPNMGLDYQAAAFEPVAYFLRTRPDNYRYIQVFIQIFYFFLQPLNMILKIIIVPIIKKKMPQFLYAAPLLIFTYFYMFNGSFWLSLKLYLFMYGIFGLIFGRVLFCGHRLQQLWTEGSMTIQDFGQHTVASTNDVDINLLGFWSYALGVGFNVHTPHHFFPTLDHNMLKPVLQILDQTCKQMKIKHHYTTRIQCFKSLSKGLVQRLPYVKEISK